MLHFLFQMFRCTRPLDVIQGGSDCPVVNLYGSNFLKVQLYTANILLNEELQVEFSPTEKYLDYGFSC